MGTAVRVRAEVAVRHRSVLSAVAPPSVRGQGHPPGATIVKPSKIAFKPVYDRRTTGDAQGHRAHVHAKMTMTFLGSPDAYRKDGQGPKAFAPEAWPHVPRAGVTSGPTTINPAFKTLFYVSVFILIGEIAFAIWLIIRL
jgi:hypothetical protein